MNRCWEWPLIILSVALYCMFVVYIFSSMIGHEYIFLIVFGGLYALCIISIFFLFRTKDRGYRFMQVATIAKTVLIPWYIFNYVLGIWGFLATIGFPLFITVTLAVIHLDIAILIITSLYSTIGIISYHRERRMKGGVLLALSQWVFCVDVVVLLVVYMVARRERKVFARMPPPL